MCVQRFDDSLNSAIHITYRISLRSSSMPEPRDPLLKVFNFLDITQTTQNTRVIVSFGEFTPAEADGQFPAKLDDSPKQLVLRHRVGGSLPAIPR
jgi:hypothetical protein